VDGQLHFEVNGYNSYDVLVRIAYAPTSTRVEDVDASSKGYSKLIRDGRLIIQSAGKTYNILGVQE
jgi:hypothetical protein